MQLRLAFVIWLISFIGFFISIKLCSVLGVTQWITFIYYIIVGCILNRKVLYNLVEWHPINNTINNVSSEKLRFLLLWIVKYPFLFFKLGIIRFL